MGAPSCFAKIAGEMVSLGAVEMLVQSLWPEHRHAVVAVPDKRRGERIVLVTTAAEADAGELRRAGKDAGLAELAVPQDIVKVDEIPILGTGKIDHPSTRRLAINRLGLPAAAWRPCVLRGSPLETVTSPIRRGAGLAPQDEDGRAQCQSHRSERSSQNVDYMCDRQENELQRQRFALQLCPSSS